MNQLGVLIELLYQSENILYLKPLCSQSRNLKMVKLECGEVSPSVSIC